MKPTQQQLGCKPNLNDNIINNLLEEKKLQVSEFIDIIGDTLQIVKWKSLNICTLHLIL